MNYPAFYVPPPIATVTGKLPGSSQSAQYVSLESDVQRNLAALQQNPGNVGQYREDVVANFMNPTWVQNGTYCQINPPDSNCANIAGILSQYGAILDQFLKAYGQALAVNYPNASADDLKPYLTRQEAAVFVPGMNSSSPLTTTPAASNPTLAQPGQPSTATIEYGSAPTPKTPTSYTDAGGIAAANNAPGGDVATAVGAGSGNLNQPLNPANLVTPQALQARMQMTDGTTLAIPSRWCVFLNQLLPSYSCPAGFFTTAFPGAWASQAITVNTFLAALRAFYAVQASLPAIASAGGVIGTPIIGSGVPSNVIAAGSPNGYVQGQDPRTMLLAAASPATSLNSNQWNYYAAGLWPPALTGDQLSVAFPASGGLYSMSVDTFLNKLSGAGIDVTHSSPASVAQVPTSIAPNVNPGQPANPAAVVSSSTGIILFGALAIGAVALFMRKKG